jgi:uncharacterized phage protein (TIGR01671 family)
MRECKFRVWDKKLKDMRYQDLQELCLGEIWFDGVCDTWCVINDANDKQERFILMQYTGLKDKKRTEQFPEGQEIYEGDILADKNNLDVSMTIVEYDEFLASYIFKHLAEESLYFRNETYSSYLMEVEVIGNVYENPELLGV